MSWGTSETNTRRVQVSTDQKGEGWDSPLSPLMWALEKGILVASVLFVGSAVTHAEPGRSAHRSEGMRSSDPRRNALNTPQEAKKTCKANHS